MDESQRDIREQLLDIDMQNLIMCDWVKFDSRRNKLNLGIIKWNSDLPKVGSEVFAFGSVGIVCDYGLQETDGMFYRCLWVKFKSDLVKTIESEVEIVTDENRKIREKEFAKKLVAAGKKVEKQKKERRANSVKGSHLVDEMLFATQGYTLDKKSTFYKITGTQKGKAVYLLIKGGRVDLSGFTLEDNSVIQITEEEAKKRHLGRVRGQIDFSHPDDVVMETFKKVLGEL